VTSGLFLIYAGFRDFYVACNIPILDVGEMAGKDGSFFTTTTFYFTPTTASAITFNFLMSFSGGPMVSYFIF
jgi:Amt family ammonium transporter